jgi:hypothetical protein
LRADVEDLFTEQISCDFKDVAVSRAICTDAGHDRIETLNALRKAPGKDSLKSKRLITVWGENISPISSKPVKDIHSIPLAEDRL